jgi:hypothetical protein
MSERNSRDRRRNAVPAHRESEPATASRPVADTPDPNAPLDRDSGLNLVATRKAFGPDITGEQAPQPAQAQQVQWSGARRELFHALYRTHFDFV